MKKLLILTTGLILCMGVFAQGAKAPGAKNNYFSFSAGVAFPTGDFSDKDVYSNEEAGLAKNGLHLNLQYAHTWGNFGVVTQVFYNNHSVQPVQVDVLEISMDHWKYYGLMAGPTFIKPLGETRKFVFDAKLMAGPVNVNSPSFSISGEQLVNEDWNTTLGLGAGMGMKYLFGKGMFAQLGIDYMSMNPEFSLQSDLVEEPTGEKYNQPISSMNIHFGLGINF